MALAIALSVALAINTGGTAALTLRYIAAFGGLGSLAQVVLAVARGRPLAERLSEWDEAIVLATLSAGAHMIASHFDKAT